MGRDTLKVWLTYIKGKEQEAMKGYRLDEAAVLYECTDRLREWIEAELKKT